MMMAKNISVQLDFDFVVTVRVDKQTYFDIRISHLTKVVYYQSEIGIV
jgi:hypothetical protein